MSAVKQDTSIRSNADGSAAVEYAIIAPVFFFMILGLIEFSLYVFSRNYVKHVLYESARTITTGEVQSADDPLKEFKQVYCRSSGPIMNCERLLFDVRAYDALEDVDFSAVEFGSNGSPLNFKFEPGEAEQISVMRVAMPYKFITPFMQEIFLGESKNAIVVGYMVSKIEPFGCRTSCD